MSEAPPPPEELRSISEALRLDTSSSVAEMLRCAASHGPGVVGLKELIAAALRVGAIEHSGTPGPQRQFAAAFAEAVASATGKPVERPPPDRDVGRPEPDPPLSPAARAAIHAARLFARLAGGEDFIAARHLVTALTFPLSPELRAALRRVWRRNWSIDVEVLRPELAAAMEHEIADRAGQGRTEDRAAWQSLFGTRRDAPAFATDAPRPARIDPLGYAEEAWRLAELACLTANEPPMAVALFGDRGAGKSTFMNRMQAAVENIGRTWRGDAQSPFCTRVAQVRFNAWTFADGDLWASLAAEIFRQLKGEIARLSGEAAAPAQYRALLDRVAMRFGAAEEKGRESLGELARINRAITAKRDELDRVDRRGAEIASAPASERLQERAGRLLQENPEAVADALATLGELPREAEGRLKTVVGEARQAVSMAGKAKLVGRLAWQLVQRPRGWLLLAIGALLLWRLPVVIGWVGFLAPLLAWSVKLAQPLLDAADAFEKAEAAERASLAARRTALEAEIATLRKQRTAMEQSQSREAAFLARYAGAAGGERPAALLKYFLEQDSSLSEYEKRLGMVARLRESFETLEALLADQARTGSNALPAIDRIVLYVDDLDRCQPAQVVPVLQALALMLQLKLFVAVVAVDARWLSAALRIHYRELIMQGAMAGPEQFLEKIFQIPFWLPPMQGGEIDRYRAFVAHLVPEAVAEADRSGGKSGGQGRGGNGRGSTEGGDGAAIDPDERPQPGDADPFALADRSDTIARVSLTAPELAVLSALAPLAGGTPRAVKRFVNLYRLMRASRSGAALDAWLGRASEPPAFAAVAFALACHAALTPDELAAMQRMRDGAQDVPLAQAWPAQKGKWGAGVPSWPATGTRIGTAVAMLEAALRGAGAASRLRVADVVDAWPAAARFSFNRPA